MAMIGRLACVTVIGPLEDKPSSYVRGSRKSRNYPIVIGEDLAATRLPAGALLCTEGGDTLVIAYPDGRVRRCCYPYCRTLAQMLAWGGPSVLEGQGSPLPTP